ncbi:MAG: protein kinase, partial [Oscillospiraceae bacterium]
MIDYIGKKLDGRYEIIELIGAGGMANVYKARDLRENRIVAVKILREEFLDNEELVRRFKNESKAIGLLSHPNIVKVFDVNFSDSVQFIVMEYIDGITLKDYIERKKPLSWKDTVHFTVQILRALQHAHDRGIVHRDIKPQNIMLLQDGSIKVMDFGIARFSRSETRTITDKTIGSVHYISPEQAKGDITDAKADLYSVGIMMYEMLTGKLPFDSDSAVSIAIKQISDNAKRPRDIVPEIPEALEEITLKAMAKNPNVRYQSASQMLRDIDDFKKNPSIV